MLTTVSITNIVPTSTKLYSELFPDESYEIKTPYEAWEGAPYDSMKNMLMIGTDAYVRLKDPEHKKAGKMGARSVKTVLVGFRDSTTYRLYDRETDQIIISSNVTFNKD